MQGKINKLKNRIYVQIHNIVINTPQGFIVEAIWRVLDKNRDLWLSSSDVISNAENEFSKMDKPFESEDQIDLRPNVIRALNVWYRNGHLQRIGQCRSYLYQLMPHVHTRPVMAMLKKTKTLQPLTSGGLA